MTWRVGALEMAPDFLVPLTNLKLWLKADQISGVSNGSRFGTWQDQSGHSNDVTQATGANQPTYVSSLAAFGGMPAVQFNGSSQWLDRNTAVAPAQKGWTIFAVLKPTATTSQQVPVYSGNDTGGFGLSNSTNTSQKGGLVGNVAWMSSSTAADTAAEVWCLEDTDPGGVGAPTNVFYLNGTATTISNPNAYPLAPNASTAIGREVASTAGRFYAGYIAEVLIYQDKCTDRAGVTAYLRSKYSI